jgi:hypothetical protein
MNENEAKYPQTCDESRGALTQRPVVFGGVRT